MAPLTKIRCTTRKGYKAALETAFSATAGKPRTRIYALSSGDDCITICYGNSCDIYCDNTIDFQTTYIGSFSWDDDAPYADEAIREEASENGATLTGKQCRIIGLKAKPKRK